MESFQQTKPGTSFDANPDILNHHWNGNHWAKNHSGKYSGIRNDVQIQGYSTKLKILAISSPN
jgi:hypothetical protein